MTSQVPDDHGYRFPPDIGRRRVQARVLDAWDHGRADEIPEARRVVLEGRRHDWLERGRRWHGRPAHVPTFTYNMLVPFPEVPELEQQEATKFLPPPMTFTMPAAAKATAPVIVQTR